MVPNEEAGYARLEPVSEVHPLTECRHVIAGHVSSTPLADESSGICGFYAQRQVVVVATVVDGDCGLDVACLTLGLPRTLANRSELRHALADYLCERAEEPWMQDLLVATAELDLDLVKESREELSSGDTTADTSAPALDNEVIGPQGVEAMSWALKTDDQALVRNIVMPFRLGASRSRYIYLTGEMSTQWQRGSLLRQSNSHSILVF